MTLWNISWVFPYTIKEFFCQWKVPSLNPSIQRLQDFTFSYIAWGVWKEQNNRLFRDKEMSENNVFEISFRLIVENYNIIPQKEN